MIVAEEYLVLSFVFYLPLRKNKMAHQSNYYAQRELTMSKSLHPSWRNYPTMSFSKHKRVEKVAWACSCLYYKISFINHATQCGWQSITIEFFLESWGTWFSSLRTIELKRTAKSTGRTWPCIPIPFLCLLLSRHINLLHLFLDTHHVERI